MGAIWPYALDRSIDADIQVVGNWIANVHFKDLRIDGTGTSVVNDSSGVNTTGPWLAHRELPNTITCDDRPPVVAPPAPSPW